MSVPSSPVAGMSSSWLRRVHLIDRFEIDWQERGEPRIGEYLDRVQPAERAPLLLELIKVDLEYRWRNGQRPRVDQYSSQFEELSQFDRLPADLIAEEIRVRMEHGDPPSDDELRQRFPDRAAEFNSWRDSVRQRPTGSAHAPLAMPSSSSEATLYSAATVSGTSAERSSANPVVVRGQLGKYELCEQVGRGGFAVVYRAWDPELRREVAITLPQPELLQTHDSNMRVMREAQSAARLTSDSRSLAAQAHKRPSTSWIPQP